MIRKTGSLALAVLLSGAGAENAAGEEGFFRWFQPFTGNRKVSVAVEGECYPREKVREQGTGFEESRGKTSILIPLAAKTDREWAATLRAGVRSIRTGAILPDTGERFPGELWDLNFGAVHRRELANGWIVGGNLALASPSDRPFSGWDETAVLLNGFLRLPAKGRNAWVFFLNYSSNREFLPHVPIPGAGYLYGPSRDFSLLAGVPLFFADWRPLDRLGLRGFYFPIHTVFLGGEYSLGGGWKVFADWRWENDRYYRAGRKDRDQRLFWYEQRLEAGIAVAAGGGVEAALAGGYAYDRFFFEGESYSDGRTENRLDISDGPFLTARIQRRF
jgi:hypothetical protein